jgi:hypothetical protein
MGSTARIKHIAKTDQQNKQMAKISSMLLMLSGVV